MKFKKVPRTVKKEEEEAPRPPPGCVSREEMLWWSGLHAVLRTAVVTDLKVVSRLGGFLVM